MRLPLHRPQPKPVERPVLPLHAPAAPMQEPETKEPTKERDPNVDFRVDLYV